MAVTTVRKSLEERTMSITSRLEAPIARVWALWSDPRLLERWWGPPTFPATVGRHEFTPGGRVSYYMEGPDGTRHNGFWDIVSLDEPHALCFESGFADEDEQPDPTQPTMTIRATMESLSATTTLLTIETTYHSVDDMIRLMDRGMEEGMTAALGQIDGFL